jgi:hypothetical protein
VLDERKLLEFLARKAKESPVGDAPLLVQHAIYEGLAERVKSGEFNSDWVQPPPGWFVFGEHVNFAGKMEFSEETTEDGMPRWERPLPLTLEPVEDWHECGDYPAPCNHDPAHGRKDADA